MSGLRWPDYVLRKLLKGDSAKDRIEHIFIKAGYLQSLELFFLNNIYI
jgi:hypothetical protein